MNLIRLAVEYKFGLRWIARQVDGHVSSLAPLIRSIALGRLGDDDALFGRGAVPCGGLDPVRVRRDAHGERVQGHFVLPRRGRRQDQGREPTAEAGRVGDGHRRNLWVPPVEEHLTALTVRWLPSTPSRPM